MSSSCNRIWNLEYPDGLDINLSLVQISSGHSLITHLSSYKKERFILTSRRKPINNNHDSASMWNARSDCRHFSVPTFQCADVSMCQFLIQLVQIQTATQPTWEPPICCYEFLSSFQTVTIFLMNLSGKSFVISWIFKRTPMLISWHRHSALFYAVITSKTFLPRDYVENLCVISRASTF